LPEDYLSQLNMIPFIVFKKKVIPKQQKKNATINGTPPVCVPGVISEDDCFYHHSWRYDVVIAFGTLSSFLTLIDGSDLD